jgi:glutathione S-transferase
MGIRFYSWPRSSGSAVHCALEELGLEYEYVELDRKQKEHKAPAYLAVNPNGKVPGLVDDGENYFEAAAILLHLGEKHGVKRSLWPSSGQPRADAMCWTAWAYADLLKFMMQYIYHGLDTAISYAPDQRSKAAADYNKSQLDGHLDMLEARLRDRDFLMGSFSLVDIPVAWALRMLTNLGGKLHGEGADRPKLGAWLARNLERPAWARTR